MVQNTSFFPPIYFGIDALKSCNEWLQEKSSDFSKVFILVDENTQQFCLPAFLGSIPAISDYELLEIPFGEESKSLAIADQLWRVLLELGADRKALLINLGGGVVSDLGGFVAGTYMRGIEYINVPTSLLAQVDASAGGKTGLDLGVVKNAVGLFNSPAAVFVFPEFISTLHPEEIKSGYAEILKHGLIAEADHFFHAMEEPELGSDSFITLIGKSIEIKNSIVVEDPLEAGRRKVLNFGHTVGHALESFMMNTDRPISHGEGVAAGMIVETVLSLHHNGLSQKEADGILQALHALYGQLPVSSDYIPDLLDLMTKDKKNTKGKLKFSLLQEIGKCSFDVEVSKDSVREVLTEYCV